MKKILALVIAVVMLVSLCSFANADDKVYTLQMGTAGVEGHLVTETDRYFIQRVEELSEGRIKIDLYTNNQLGDPRSMLEAVSMGNSDICDVGLPQYAQFTNALKFFSLPFLWNTRSAAFAFLDTEMGAKFIQQVEDEAGVHILGFNDDGFFNFTTNWEVKGPEDVKGMKMRCQESDVLLQIWSDLGASPLPMSLSEVYTALQQGAIDGQMNGYVTNFTNNYFEVQDYIYKLGLLYDVMVVGISADVYYSLPEDLQDVLDQAYRDSQEWNIEQAREENQRCAEGWVEAGGQIIDLTGDLEPWKEATKPTYDWFRETFPEIDLDAILETVNELNEQYADDLANEVI